MKHGKRFLWIVPLFCLLAACGGQGTQAESARWDTFYHEGDNVQLSLGMTQAEVDTVLNEVVPYWKGKTSHELYLNMLPRETRRVIYGDEEYATQGLIFDEANNAHTLSRLL